MVNDTIDCLEIVRGQLLTPIVKQYPPFLQKVGKMSAVHTPYTYKTHLRKVSTSNFVRVDFTFCYESAILISHKIEWCVKLLATQQFSSVQFNLWINMKCEYAVLHLNLFEHPSSHSQVTQECVVRSVWISSWYIRCAHLSKPRNFSNFLGVVLGEESGIRPNAGTNSTPGQSTLFVFGVLFISVVSCISTLMVLMMYIHTHTWEKL